MNLLKTSLRQFYIKELFIIIALFANFRVLQERFTSFDSIPSAAFYSVIFLGLVAVVFLASYIRHFKTRLVFGLLFLGGYVFIDGYDRTTGSFLTYPDYISMVRASGFLGEALNQYMTPLLTSLLFGLLLLVGILLPTEKKIPLPQWMMISAPVASVVGLTLLLFMRGGDGAKALPPMFTSFAYSNLYLFEVFTKQTGDRQLVDLKQNRTAEGKDIVYVIDESIRGDFLDLNSEYGVFSNLKKPSSTWNVTNYGIAASIATCSDEVNVTLRYGGTRDGYQRIIDTFPSIWAYAKKAGYHTTYIDTQRTGKRLQNQMDEIEIADIEDFVQFDGTPVLNRDMLAADKIAELSKNGRSDFILVNKMGAHFPVHDKYPDDFMKYTPVLKRGQFINISDSSDKSSFDGGSEWPLYRNSYRNTLLWNVGEFFSRLESTADFSQMTMIYTSDHGQDLHIAKNKGKITHCSGQDARIEEGIVPLVILEGVGQKTLDWNKSLEKNFNRSSHYNIFPTILSLMNYDRTEVEANYGRSLDQEVKDPYTFNVRFNARFGKRPVWKKVELEKIAKPKQPIEFKNSVSLSN